MRTIAIVIFFFFWVRAQMPECIDRRAYNLYTRIALLWVPVDAVLSPSIAVFFVFFLGRRH